MDPKDQSQEMVTRMMAILAQIEHAQGTDVHSRQKIERLQQILAGNLQKTTTTTPSQPEGQPLSNVAVEQEIDNINQRLQTLQDKVDNLDPMARQLLMENAEDWLASLQNKGKEGKEG